MIELLRVLSVHDAVFECDDFVRQGAVWQRTCKMTVRVQRKSIHMRSLVVQTRYTFWEPQLLQKSSRLYNVCLVWALLFGGCRSCTV